MNARRRIHRHTETDAVGAFRIDGLPRRCRVALRMKSDTNHVVRVPCPPVELKPLHVLLTARVVDHRNQPIALAPISVQGPGFGTGLTTDRDGKVQSHLPPGWYLLSVFVPGHAGRTRVGRLRAGRPVKVLTLRLPVGRTLRGRVLDSAGAPVADCRVVATHWLRHLERHEATTDREGHFTLPHLRGDYRFAFHAAGFVMRAVSKRVRPRLFARLWNVQLSRARTVTRT